MNKSKKTIKYSKIAAVDLFCGAGGLTHGLIAESIAVRAGFDIDRVCQYAFEKNNKAPFIIKDVAQVTSDDIVPLFAKDEIKVLAGCAPCQPFSKYTQGRRNKKDQKWGMLYEFSRLIEELRPEIVTMENVPQVRKYDVYEDFKQNLEQNGYNVWAGVVFCPDYGIPQTRQRLVLLASQIGEICLRPPTHTPENYVTVEDTISHLPPISQGEKHPDDNLHLSSRLSELNLQRIQKSKPNGTWFDWDEGLIADCHKKKEERPIGAFMGECAGKHLLRQSQLNLLDLEMGVLDILNKIEPYLCVKVRYYRLSQKIMNLCPLGNMS